LSFKTWFTNDNIEAHTHKTQSQERQNNYADAKWGEEVRPF